MINTCRDLLNYSYGRALRGLTHGYRIGRFVHGPPIREPIPALVGAADRIRAEHPARVRRRLGWGGHEDHRPSSGRERGRSEDEVLPRDARLDADLDEEAIGAALHSSWNWELISDKTLDWWVPRIGRIKRAYPTRVLVASIMAGSGSDAELSHWQTLARACQDEGADAIELNLSCPHMDRPDMGSNIGKDAELIAIVCRAVKEVARVPVWAKLTPSTTDIVVEARGVFLGGADAISSSNTFPSLPLIDPETLEFEMNVDGFVSSGGLGGPAIPPLVAGEGGAAHEGVSRQVVLGHRWHRRVQSRAQLLPPRLRHGPGVHRGDARSRCRPERGEAFSCRG